MKLRTLLTTAVTTAVLAVPAAALAHGSCDHADHTHRRYQAIPPRTWVEHWRYLRTEPAHFYPTYRAAYDVWSVDGRTVNTSYWNPC